MDRYLTQGDSAGGAFELFEDGVSWNPNAATASQGIPASGVPRQFAGTPGQHPPFNGEQMKKLGILLEFLMSSAMNSPDGPPAPFGSGTIAAAATPTIIDQTPGTIPPLLHDYLRR